MSTPNDRALISRRTAIARLATSGSMLAACGDDPATSTDAGRDAASDVGRTDAATDGSGGGARPLRVGIIGGGIAGVTTAWLLDGACETVIFEAREEMGGNIRSEPIEFEGQTVVIDMGAQYFNPGPYPTYVRLLDALGIRDIDDLDASGTYETPSTITLREVGRDEPRFVSPLPPDRSWPLTTDWNADGVNAFALVSSASRRLESQDASYLVTLDEWLDTLNLTDAQRDDIIIPWVASLFSGSLAEARNYSARASMTFLSLAEGDGLLQSVKYSTFKRGMIEVVADLLEDCTTLTLHTNAAVTRISRGGRGWLIEANGGLTDDVDVLVITMPADAAATLLADVPDTEARREALGRIEFHDARLMLHSDPIYADPNPENRSFVNVLRDGDYSEVSMSMAAVVAPGESGEPPRLWKSWVNHRAALPANVLHTEDYRHLRPTVGTTQGQLDLSTMQGELNLYFAGGWTLAYDSQETAILSAMAIANALELGQTERMAVLTGA